MLISQIAIGLIKRLTFKTFRCKSVQVGLFGVRVACRMVASGLQVKTSEAAKSLWHKDKKQACKLPSRVFKASI